MSEAIVVQTFRPASPTDGLPILLEVARTNPRTCPPFPVGKLRSYFSALTMINVFSRIMPM